MQTCSECGVGIEAPSGMRFCPMCGSAYTEPARFEPAIVAPDDREVVQGELLGWRAWDLNKLGKLYRLSSVTANAHWPVDEWCYAICPKTGMRYCELSPDGRCPGENCKCGLYSARSFHHLTQELEYANVNPRRADKRGRMPNKIIGQVAMAGKVIPGTQGFRAERARVAHLYVNHADWKIGKILSEQYGVPYDLQRW